MSPMLQARATSLFQEGLCTSQILGGLLRLLTTATPSTIQLQAEAQIARLQFGGYCLFYSSSYHSARHKELDTGVGHPQAWC